MAPKSEDGGVHVNDMLPAPESGIPMAGGSNTPKFDQNELIVIRSDSMLPKNDADTPHQEFTLPTTTDQIPKVNLAAVPPPAAALEPMSLPTADTTPIVLNNTTTSFEDMNTYAQQQHTSFIQEQELKEQATLALQQETYQAAAAEIQNLLSTVHRQNNITIEDLDKVYRAFDTFMSSHPVLSHEFLEAKTAQQAAMLALPTMAPQPPLKPDLFSMSLDELLLPRLPVCDSWSSLPGGSSLLDPFAEGAAVAAAVAATAAAGGHAAVGSASLIQDVAAAYFSHMSQSSQTDPAEDLYINTLRCHLLDKANIDSAAVQVLQQLSCDVGSGGSGGGGGGDNPGDAGAGVAAAAVLADKVKHRRGASCDDLAGSALISLGTSQLEKGPSRNAENFENDKF